MKRILLTQPQYELLLDLLRMVEVSLPGGYPLPGGHPQPVFIALNERAHAARNAIANDDDLRAVQHALYSGQKSKAKLQAQRAWERLKPELTGIYGIQNCRKNAGHPGECSEWLERRRDD